MAGNKGAVTLPAALRLVGGLLASAAAASAATGLFSAIGTWVATSGPEASMGLVVLFMGAALQSFWQMTVGAAVALLCFAAARLLEAAN